MPLFHTLAVPASVALIVCALYLGRRRHRAWQAALALLVVLGALDLVKGFDFEEATLSFAVAALLWLGRGAFYVRHDPTVPRALLRALAAATASVTLVAGFVVAIAHVYSARLIAHETADLLLWRQGPIAFGDDAAWPLAGAIALGGLLALAYLAFRPLAPPVETDEAPRQRAGPHTRPRHARLLQAPPGYAVPLQLGPARVRRVPDRGERDAALRRSCRRARLAPARARETCAFAERHGLRLGAVGVGASTLPLFRDAGLRAMYIGDEAIVETATFSLDGRAIRKVRQSVSRLEAAGYSIEAQELGQLDPPTRAELDLVSARWLDGAPERGFSMAMDSLDAAHRPRRRCRA